MKPIAPDTLALAGRIERERRWPRLACSVLLMAGIAGTGAAFPPDAWYRALLKPEWCPPDAIFALVWLALYAMLAAILWLVWIDTAANRREWRSALLAFALQLLLNAAWTPLFFGAHLGALAFADLCALWLASIVTVLQVSSVRPGAALLLVPYAAWVSFAVVLNGTIWLMNR